MKKALVFVLVSAMGSPALWSRAAFAAEEVDIQAISDKTDELELEQEVENMEQFGESAAAEETRRETDRLTREARDLEKQIAKTKRANERAVSKSKRLAELYKKKAALAAEFQVLARKAEREKSKSDKVVANLEYKVKDKEQKAIRAIERRKTAETSVRQLKRDQKRLEKRLRVAEQTIKRNDKIRKAERARALKLSRRNAKLNRQVVSAERKAGRTY